MVHSHTGVFIGFVRRKEHRYSAGWQGRWLGGFSPDEGGPGSAKDGPHRPSPLNRGKTKGAGMGSWLA
jgi:hypothetical protein